MSRVVYVHTDPPEVVSRQWYVLLHDVRHVDRVPFHVNEGHRTFARQAQLFAENMIAPGVPKPGQALTAVPSNSAPHIKTGRADHAIDFNNAAGVQRAAARRGVTLRLTVPGESWHLEPDPGELRRYFNANKARVLGIGCRTLRKGIRPGKDVENVRHLLHEARDAKGRRYWPSSRTAGWGYGLRTRRAVLRFKRDHGLPHDTVVGRRTYEALLKAAKRHKG